LHYIFYKYPTVMKKLFILSILSLISSLLFAQSSLVELDKLAANNFPEKIYVQYDKPSYFAGEIIWYKIYITHNDTPSTKTTVVSIELLNDSGKIIEKKILPVTMGAASGNFTVNKNNRSGTYTVRAFTEKHVQLKNEDCYQHPINIYGISSAAAKAPLNEDSVLVYFLPEGGNVISGVKNMFAFKCSDKFGIPLKIAGEIVDSKGEFVTNFKDMHDGMGLFGFFPQAGQAYYAECTINNNIKKRIQLPESIAQGITFQVSNATEKTIFTIDASTVTIDELKPGNLVAVQNDVIVFSLPLQLNGKKIVQGILPLDKLPSGVLQLTVFNSNNQPLAERLVFVDNDDYKTGIDFKMEAIDLNPRKKNVFSLGIADTIPGTFAVAVTEMIGDPNMPDNIIARLLLTESLKGYIHQPAYYFESKDKMRNFYLDLVMLTHGWRRYSWKKADTYPKKEILLQSDNYITFKARAINLQNNQPIRNKTLQVQVKTRDKDEDILIMTTDSSGVFTLAGMIYEDSLQISVKGKARNNYVVGVQILSRQLSDQFNFFKNSFHFSMAEKDQEKNTFFAKNNFLKAYQNPKEILLQSIEIKAKAKSEKDKFTDKYVTGRMGISANQLDLISNPVQSGLNILDYIKSRMMGITVTGSPGSYLVNYRGARTLTAVTPMAIFLDEFQVEANDLTSIRAADVALVSVHNTAINGPGGALAIYTKRDNGGNKVASSSNVFFTYEGFSPTKEFFSPDYEKVEDARISNDERVTLYWNPYINTTASNNAFSFSFYNNDSAKKIKVTIEGMQKDGKLLHFEKIIE
jgi:hypothetical protein